MSKRVPNGARAVTVAAMILACLLMTAAYTVPAQGQSTETSTPPAAVDSSEDGTEPEEGTEEEPAPEDDGAQEPAGSDDGDEETAEKREYEPEPEPSPEREYEPEPSPSPSPEPSPSPSPEPSTSPDPASEPEPEPEPEPDPPAGQPVGAAGSTPQEAFEPEADPPPADAPEDDSEGAAGSPSSARAVGPGLSNALRSSTAEEPFDGDVLAPLVAPRDVARADDARGSRRGGASSDALTRADRELLASAGPFPSGPSTLTVGSDTPSWPVPLAAVLLLVMATLVGRTYAGQRTGTDTPAA